MLATRIRPIEAEDQPEGRRDNAVKQAQLAHTAIDTGVEGGLQVENLAYRCCEFGDECLVTLTDRQAHTIALAQ